MELGFIITYIMVISILGIIFTSAANQGVFATVVFGGRAANYTNFTINNTNWTVNPVASIVEPPVCQPVIQGIPIPILDDVGCLGVIISWLNGLRTFTSTSVWFIAIFILPITIMTAIMIVRLFRGN